MGFVASAAGSLAGPPGLAASVAASLVGRGLRLGPVRLTVYGACAATGVVTAMALGSRAAQRVGVAAEAVWDAGLFAVVSCFVASRLLLVLSDPQAFVRYPLPVLGLPSLTIGGMGLAAVAVWLYLRRKRLPVLRLLDTFAPGGAVLAAFLELGHWMDGSEVGMPILRGSAPVGYRPVGPLAVVLALVLAVLLGALLSRPWRPGRVASTGMMLGGLAAFGMDMISLPSDVPGTLWLEPGQIVSLGATLAGACLWTFAPESIVVDQGGSSGEKPALARLDTDLVEGRETSLPFARSMTGTQEEERSCLPRT